MGGTRLPRELVISRSFEHAQIMMAIENQPGVKTEEATEENKEILLGVIKDDWENHKEIFIPAK